METAEEEFMREDGFQLSYDLQYTKNIVGIEHRLLLSFFQSVLNDQNWKLHREALPHLK